MLGEELSLTFTIVLTLLVANVIGGIAAFLLAAHLARVVLVRATVLVPVILSVVLIGAVQASRQWEDMGFPIAIGLVGWVMKRVRWSRSPLVLAFILVPLVEQYYFISMWLHGWRWLLEPAVAVILVATAILLVVLGVRGFRSARARLADGQRRALHPALDADAVTAVAVCAVSALAQVTAGDRAASARAIPQLVAALTFAAVLGALFMGWWRPVSATDAPARHPTRIPSISRSPPISAICRVPPSPRARRISGHSLRASPRSHARSGCCGPLPSSSSPGC